MNEPIEKTIADIHTFMKSLVEQNKKTSASIKVINNRLDQIENPNKRKDVPTSVTIRGPG